jgi:hypothetical protein
VSNTARAIGLLLCLGMLAFSTWMYVRTGDWVAAVFAVASMAYGVFFMSSGGGFRRS